MTGAQGGGAAGSGEAARAAQERLTEEARATASALLDWLGTRVDGAAPGAGDGAQRSSTQASGDGAQRSSTQAPGDGAQRSSTDGTGAGTRPPQSSGPCSWCPVCALVAALRGEQPELTARLAEQASGLMTLLRLMVQAHQGPGHEHDLSDLGPRVPEPARGTPPGASPAHWGTVDGGGAPLPPVVADLAAAGLGDPDPDPDHTQRTSGDAVPEAEVPTRPRGRQAPVRRASPRSAAFRRTPGPATPPGRPGSRSVAPSVPSPPAGGRVVEPDPAAPPPAPRAPRPGNPAGGAARPSVQRIAIRRPGRSGTGGEAGGTDRSRGPAPRPDEPC